MRDNRCKHDVHGTDCFECFPKVEEKKLLDEHLEQEIQDVINVFVEEGVDRTLARRISFAAKDKILPKFIAEHERLLKEREAQVYADCIKSTDDWLDLLETDHLSGIRDKIYQDPQEAGREYRNQCNLLGAVRAELRKKAARGKETNG